MNLNKTGVLFDLDGVLIDTETQYSVFWGNIGKEYLTDSTDFAEKIKGSNLTAILDNHFPDKKLQEIIVARLDEFQASMKYEIYPGVKDFVNQLIEHNIPMCIVTSSDDNKMNSLFEQQPYFKETFKNIITGSQVTNSKPHPECFLKGAKLINRDIADCYIFEDSLQGITAGIASGAKVIALDTTCHKSAIEKLTTNIISSFENFGIDDMFNI